MVEGVLIALTCTHTHTHTHTHPCLLYNSDASDEKNRIKSVGGTRLKTQKKKR